MKHTCKNCIYCNLISKDSNGYKTLCRFRPELIPGKVERCTMKTTVWCSPAKPEEYELMLTLLQNTNFMGNVDVIERIKPWSDRKE